MAFSGGSNAVLVNNCQNLQNLTVTLQVTQDLITLGDTGFSLQLNCYPPPGVTSVGLTLNWIQYTLYVSNNTGAFQWQAWALGATGWPQGQPQGTTQSQQPVPPFSQPNAVIATVPSNWLPAGSSLTIALTTAPSSQRVTAATFTVQLAGAAAKSVTLDFPASVPFNFVTGAPGVPVDAQFPIAGFQVDLVGPGNLATAAFTSGAGEITYSVSSGSGLSVQNGGVGTACGQYTGALTGENSNVVYGDVTPSSGATVRQPFSVPVATNVSSFQPVQPGNMAIYVLGSDGNLWFETGPFGQQIPPNRLQVDANVLAFQALDGNDVFVLGSDGNLWLETWPFGNLASTIQRRLQLDGNVAAFQAIVSSFGNKVFVLGKDRTLWWEPWPTGNVGQTVANREIVDANVQTFFALDVYDVVVLGGDGNLWFEGLPFGSLVQTQNNRKQIDANVKAFWPIDAYNMYVLGADGTLWFEPWPVPNTPQFNGWGDVQETIRLRKIVDQNVAAIQAIDINTVFVLGTDGNLWLETSPWGNVSQTVSRRQHIGGNVTGFFAWTAARDFFNYWVVLVRDTNGNLWYETPPASPSTTWVKFQIDGNVMT